MFNYFISSLMALFLLSGCNQGSTRHKSTKEWMQKNHQLKVLSTIAMIDDLVRQIGGEYVDPAILIKGDLDPHSYQIVKGDDEKLAFADVIFFSGLGLEHGPSLQGYLHNHDKAIGLGDRLIGEEPPLLLYFKGQSDPHIWMDISLWTRVVPYIAEVLSQKDPAHAEIYQKNADKLVDEMMEVHRKIKEELHQIPASKRYLVTSHDAFNYFTRAYLAEPGEDAKSWSNRFAAPEGLAPESQISTIDIQEIINHLSQFNIHVIFPESNVNRDSIKKIVQAGQQKGLNVHINDTPLFADAMGKEGSNGDTYLKMIQHNAKVIGEGLKQNGG
jgi:manganese/zinc/iron transport system substrate-binding protein